MYPTVVTGGSRSENRFGRFAYANGGPMMIARAVAGAFRGRKIEETKTKCINRAVETGKI
uniref:Uncharacterized protein n=1 Tax=Anopheles dirus TaxID=7168 RepID=A0A182NWE2_9DIPT